MRSLKIMFGCSLRCAPGDFYTWMDFFFKMFGLQPPKGGRKKLLYLLVAVSHIFISMVLLTCSEWLELLRLSKEDFEASMMTLSVCVLHSIIIFRVAFWFFTREKLAKVREVVQRESFEFRCFSVYDIKYSRFLRKGGRYREKGNILEYGDLKKLWYKANIFVNDQKNRIEPFRKQTMARTRMLCCCFYLGINFITLLTIGTSYVNVLVTEEYENFNPKRNITSTYRVYPYHTYFPFDTSLSHGFYWQGYFYQIYAYCSVMLIFLPIDTIITNSILHVINQIRVISEAFSEVGENMDYKLNADTVLLLQEIRIVKCISELQEIYRAVRLLEDLCNVQLLIQYGASVFILCSLCYIIPLVNNAGEFICSLIFLSATLGEIFIFTYSSQTLSVELQNVANAVYNLNWPNYPPKLRRNLVFLISGLQKPRMLTAGKIINLDLLFFIQVTQKAYSFYTLISNTNK